MVVEKLLKGVVPPETFARQIYPHDPPGIRAFRLRRWVVDQGDHIAPEVVSYMRACVDEADRISDEMVERNRRARELEQSGQIEDAAALYMQNVRDRFDGNMPYERLRVIFNRQKRYEDALQVCRAFISMVDRLLRLGSPREDLETKRAHFTEWSQKLQERLD